MEMLNALRRWFCGMRMSNGCAGHTPPGKPTKRSVFSIGAGLPRTRPDGNHPAHKMRNINMKRILPDLDYDVVVVAILPIFNIILFAIMIATGHPVVGSICSILLAVLWFLYMVEN